MREILFRGKRVTDGEWLEGSLWVHIGVPKILTPANNVGYDVDPATVGQYTGMQDMAGTRIFEGDILYDDFEEENVTVDFEHGSFWLNYQGHTDNEWYDIADNLTVIGNIHDNQELFGGGNDG